MNFFEILMAKLKVKFPNAKDEDFADLATDAELLAALEEDQSAALDQSVEALKKKNNDLIKEKRTLQQKLRDGGGEDVSQYEAKINDLSDQVTTLTGQIAAKDREITKISNKIKTDTDKLSVELKTEKERNIKTIMDKAILESVGKLDLTNKDLLPIIQDHFSKAFSIIEENGERKVIAKYIGDDGKEAQLAAADYAEYWAKTTAGQAVVKAKASGGAGDAGAGGAQQNKGSGAGAGAGVGADPFSELKFS